MWMLERCTDDHKVPSVASILSIIVLSTPPLLGHHSSPTPTPSWLMVLTMIVRALAMTGSRAPSDCLFSVSRYLGPRHILTRGAWPLASSDDDSLVSVAAAAETHFNRRGIGEVIG